MKDRSVLMSSLTILLVMAVLLSTAWRLQREDVRSYLWLAGREIVTGPMRVEAARCAFDVALWEIGFTEEPSDFGHFSISDSVGQIGMSYKPFWGQR